MTCPQCQELLAENTRFCRRCGLRLTSENRDTIIAVARDTGEGSRPSDSLLGKVLDAKYELMARLGSGATGTVYRARRLHIGDEVAIKILSQDYVLADSAMERFRREARSAAMIRHPNVVSIHDFCESKPGEPAYIVMELVRGVSLRELLQQEGRLSAARAVALMGDICSGVGVAHRQGVVHRDLKPDNIIVTAPEFEGERETAKVVDFGIAKLRDTTAEFKVTKTGTLVGTPFYMSPEQLHGETLDARSDVYSLGAMLYEMLAGTPPFNANSLAELITKQLNNEPPPFDPSLNLPPALESVCRRAMAKQPAARPSDASVLGRDLQSALASSSSGIESIESPRSSLAEPTVVGLPSIVSIQPSTQGRKSHAVAWAIAGVFAFVLLAVAVAAMFSMRSFIGGRNTNTANANSTAARNTSNANPEESQTAENSNSGSVTPLANQAGLVGKWTGTYGPSNNPAKLEVKEYQDGKFSGILEQGQVRVAVTGTVDPKSRRVKIKETQVLSGSGWSLGEDEGEISSDGRKMSGTGQDAVGGQFGMTYQWSFVK
jgi:serine/threonine protein kinase